MKKYIIMGCLAMTLQNTIAQQIPVLNQYVFNPYVYNPARAGDTRYGNIWLSHKRQWANMPNAPITSILSFDMPLAKTNAGIGAVVYSDKTHLINNVGGLLSYAYHIPFNQDKTHRLSIGVSAGVINQQFDFLQAKVETWADNSILLRSSNNTTFDATAGLNYNYKKLNIGVSVPQVLNQSIRYRRDGRDSVNYAFARHFLANASYRFGNEKIGVQPILTMMAVKNLPIQFGGMLIADYKDLLKIGGGYRSGNDFGTGASWNATVGLKLNKRVTIGYNYESSLDKLDKTSLGASHEFVAGYRFGVGNEELEEKLKKIQDQLDQVKNDQESLRQQVVQNTADIDDLKSKTGEHDDRLNNLEQKVNNVEGQVKDNSSKISDNNNKINDANEKIKELMAKINNMNSNNKVTASSIAFKKLGAVGFSVNSFALSAETKANLDALKSVILSKGGNYAIYLAGNASEEGGNIANMILSTQRASAVKKYLEAGGVTQPIFILSYGEESPVTPHQNNEVERQPNRRVDIYITTNE